MIGITERGDAALHTEWLKWADQGKPTILITKAPSLLIYLIDEKAHNVIVHCTITGFGGTVIEPGVGLWQEEIKAYHELCKMLGARRVVLRINPIMPTRTGIATALSVFEQRVGRVRISFMDMYPHVRERLSKLKYIPFWEGIHAPLQTRTEAAARFEGAEICGEPGFKCTGCVSAIDCNILSVNIQAGKSRQRNACACLAMKQELLTHKGQCAHQCVYCYWR